MSESERVARVRDFESRIELAPNSVQIHPAGWKYIPVHEFRSAGVDAYWLMGTDAYFLQVWQQADDVAGRTAGLYFRWSPGVPAIFNLVAVVEDAIDRKLFEAVMSAFAGGLPPSSKPDSLMSFPYAAT